MIIGISGKKQSGKDTIANIIMYQSWVEKSKQGSALGLTEFNPDVKYQNRSGWKVVRFADKLKDMVCLLLGCSREDLEKEEFKNSPLGEEWRVYYLSRKNKISQWSRLGTKEYIENRCKAFKGEMEVRSTLYTPRMVLQILGTDLFRKEFHPDVWVNATMAAYKPLTFEYPESYIKENPDKPATEQVFPGWIIPDVRFPNEANAIKERGGILIRVERDGVKRDSHESETALDNYGGFDYVFRNNGSIQKLLTQVSLFLIHASDKLNISTP
jgi:hypothetical protein